MNILCEMHFADLYLYMKPTILDWKLIERMNQQARKYYKQKIDKLFT